MRKILLISNGNSIHTIKWVKELQKKYKIFLFDWRPISISNYDSLENVVVIKQKSFFSKKNLICSYLYSFYKAKNISKNILPDIVHSHYATSYGLLGLRAKKNKLIVSVWGTDITDFPNKSLLHRLLVKFILNRSDYIFSTSNFLSRKVKDLSKRKSFITPFGVKGFEDKKIKKKSETIILGTAKNLTNFSGVDLALKCFSKLKSRYIETKIKFEIAGDGPERKKIESIIYKLGLTKDVNLLGYIDHKKIYDFMSRIDIYINLPQKESFGVSVLEASAAGKPIIASNIGGLPEIVKNEETGIIVNLDEEQIVEAMIDLVKNENKRTVMGKNGRKFVDNFYSWDESAQIMLSYYERIFNGKI
tara:strand:- start:701 stop:1783 length:1083 start_codon:yes stop_codon:yes gene_type:complete